MSRVTAKTPKWFKVIRNIGLALTGVSTVILSAGVALPAVIITIAGYAAVGGGVMAAVAQTAKEHE